MYELNNTYHCATTQESSLYELNKTYHCATQEGSLYELNDLPLFHTGEFLV